MGAPRKWLAGLLSRGDRSVPVRCQDEHGRRAVAVVRPTEGVVRLEGTGLGTIDLPAAQVDQLREALRAAVFDLDRLDEDDTAPERAIVVPEQRLSR